MKKILIPMTVLFTTALLLVACSDDDNQNGNSDKTDPSENAYNSQPEKKDDTEESSQIDKKGDESESTSKSEETATDDSNETPSKKKENEGSNNQSKSEEVHVLSEYSSEEIEYARVWLQLGPNPEIDELNVRRIPAGEPVNLYDDTSAKYPKDVIQLGGSRSVDGSVTYSGNGDGTINVYDVPSHWASSIQVDENIMKEYTEEIIKNTKLVSIDPGDDKEIIKLIEMLNVPS